jgi:hypothetical protein
MSGGEPDPTDESVAEVTGRLAGRAVTRIGVSLLRMGPIRSAIRRAVEEASAETGERRQDESPESE